jgi:hypothetical protein
MAALALVLALVSGFTNACTEVLQRIANVSAPKHLKGLQMAWAVVRQPIWVLGIAFMGITLVVTAAALYFGSVSLVQPVLVTELVFTLGLRRFWMHDAIVSRSWIAALVTCVGLAGFLVAAHPVEGQRVPSADAWVLALVTRGLAIVILLAISRACSPGVAAVLTGSAAGLAWAVDAAIVKEAMNALSRGGVVHLFESWSLYGAVVTGIVGTLLVQLSLHVGPLSASQPAIVITDPLMSILLGVQLFGDHLNSGPGSKALQAVMLVVMSVGVVLLSRWAPPRIEARNATSPVEPTTTDEGLSAAPS